MASFSLNDFRSRMQDGGARPNLFEMEINFPGGDGGATSDSRYLCKVSEIPGSTVGVIEVPFMGRKLKIAGDRTFATLSVTMINDEGFHVRGRMEQWMDTIAHHETARGATSLNSYQQQLMLTQLARSGSGSRGAAPIRYSFVDAFPTALSTIAVDWSAVDTIEEYTVEFQYQYWTSTAVAPGAGWGVSASIGAVFG